MQFKNFATSYLLARRQLVAKFLICIVYIRTFWIDLRINLALDVLIMQLLFDKQHSFQFLGSRYAPVREGLKKRQIFHFWVWIPPLEVEKNSNIFLRPFFEHFFVKCFFTIENPKNLFKKFQKMKKLQLDKHIFASSDARFEKFHSYLEKSHDITEISRIAAVSEHARFNDFNCHFKNAFEIK